jgi:predicted lipid carrier protein YhbT
VNNSPIDCELRLLVAAIEGAAREPAGRSYHLHQLDGARLEAMVYLDPSGARVEWLHGKADCAITGEGEAILAVLRGDGDPDGLEADGRLVLYGDRELIAVAGRVFNPRPGVTG